MVEKITLRQFINVYNPEPEYKQNIHLVIYPRNRVPDKEQIVIGKWDLKVENLSDDLLDTEIHEIHTNARTDCRCSGGCDYYGVPEIYLNVEKLKGEWR